MCEPKYKIGLFGSLYFAGFVSTVLIFPLISDRCCGRKKIIITVLVITIIALIGLLVTTNLIEGFVYIFLVGACAPGRAFVMLTNAIEFVTESNKYIVTFWYLGSEPVVLIFITFWYQFIDRNWFMLQLLFMIFLVLTTTLFWLLVPESPKWLYIKRRFEESRQVIKEVANFNSVSPEPSFQF